ncbi:unnamed protein product [Schistosoma curassoni]|nr:unnamed protein product [Schistosoma curassoni]
MDGDILNVLNSIKTVGKDNAAICIPLRDLLNIYYLCELVYSNSMWGRKQRKQTFEVYIHRSTVMTFI